MDIKIIIGLGNPGSKFNNTRHNIGFHVVDRLVEQENGQWSKKDNMELSEIFLNNKKVVVVKPQTFMNDSGKVLQFFKKNGIIGNNVLVVHDELELPFNTIKYKFDGSAKGHNGLKSIINFIGKEFHRIRFGIGRPESREEVNDYVLGKFTESFDEEIDKAISMIEDCFKE